MSAWERWLSLHGEECTVGGKHAQKRLATLVSPGWEGKGACSMWLSSCGEALDIDIEEAVSRLPYNTVHTSVVSLASITSRSGPGWLLWPFHASVI